MNAREPSKLDQIADRSVFTAGENTETTASPMQAVQGAAVFKHIESVGPLRFEQPGARQQVVLKAVLFLIPFMICMLANVCVPVILAYRPMRNLLGASEIRDMIGFVAVGGLVAQLGILSIYMGMGPTSLKVRAIAAMVLAVFVCSSYILGLQAMDWPNPSSLPTFIALLLYGVGLGGFLVASAAMGIFSRLTRIGLRQSSSASNRAPDQSFSIAYLIVLTTVVALAVTAVRASFPSRSEVGPPPPQVLVILLLSFQHACYSILLILCCAWTVLRRGQHWQGALGLLALLLIAGPANLLLMGSYRVVGLSWEIAGYLWAYTSGLLLTTLIFLVMIRVAGYWLERWE